MNISLKLLFILTGFLNISSVHSQSILDGIPDSLIDGAHLVVLNEDYIFTISDIDESVTDYKLEYVVLKKSDYIPGYLSIVFDKYTKIKKARIEIFDENNKRIKKIKLNKFNKELFIDNNTISDDSGVKYAVIPDISPPYKIVFSYQVIRKDNNAFFPVWQVVDNEYQSVKTARFKVIDKVGDNLLYKSINLPSPDIRKNENDTEYEWKLNNFKYVKFESLNKKKQDYFPTVLLASRHFVVEDFEGEMVSWDSIGRFVNKMLDNRNNLTEEQKQEIKAAINEDDSDYDKIKKIYEYLQNTTRYVSIQLGIGGWQPFTTGYVHEKKYGDCKALTFYMKSMLDLVGIPSYYTLVKAGKYADDISSDFPFMRFNHAFLCVPVEKDTIWLECTSQFLPFGYSGSFTDDRNVLVVNEDGADLVRSKVYSAEENTKTVKVNINLDPENNNAFVSIKTGITGLAIEDDNYFLVTKTNRGKQKTWLKDIINLDNYDIKSFKINPVEGDIIPRGSYSVNLISRNLFVKAGHNLLFKPFIFNPFEIKTFLEDSIKHNFYIRHSFVSVDSITVQIPSGYQWKKSEGNFDLKTKFGEYSTDIKQNGSKLIFSRKVKLLKGNYLPDDYKEFKKFINTISRKDNKRYIFEKIEDSN